MAVSSVLAQLRETAMLLYHESETVSLSVLMKTPLKVRANKDTRADTVDIPLIKEAVCWITSKKCFILQLSHLSEHLSTCVLVHLWVTLKSLHFSSCFQAYQRCCVHFKGPLQEKHSSGPVVVGVIYKG